MDLQKIYEELVVMSFCISAYQFSEDFLGMNKSYYGMLKANAKKPSTTSLVNLYCSLQSKIDNFNRYQTQELKVLNRIANDVKSEIDKRGLSRFHC